MEENRKNQRKNFLNLKPLQSEEGEKRSKPFFVYDIETQNWTNHVLGGCYDGVNTKHFKTVSEFLQYAFDTYDGYDCFAHFGGRFDYLFIIKDILESDLYEIGEITPRGSGILFFTVTRRCDGSTIAFRDSSALLPFSLKRITENFNTNHIKQDFDVSKITKITSELIEYNTYDLKGLYESLEAFFNWPIIKKAGHSYTLAGQALRVFRTYLNQEIPALSKGIDAEIRAGYLGGRTEIFKPVYHGKNPLYAYDVNSLYPYVMRENQFPGGFFTKTFEYTPKRMGIYETEVIAPDIRIPALGIVHEGKYIFPTGKFKGTFTTAEMEYAKTLGYKFKPKRGWLFENAGFIFKAYINDLYSIRLKSKPQSVDNMITKLLMNSLYGRFGITRDKENIVFDDGSDGLKPLREIKAGGNTYRLMTKDVELQTFSNVAIAAFVTSYARIHMHKLFMQAPDEIYYTDTDSIYTTHKFPTGDKLGELKEEDKVNSACFLLPKTYIAGKKITMKGFDKKKISHFTFDDFYACLEGDLKHMKVIQEPKFATFKTAIRQNILVGMTKESTRQLRTKYDKRVLIKTGKYSYDSKAIKFE